MQFYVKYTKDGDTVVIKLDGCRNRGDAVKKLEIYKDASDDDSVSLTSDPVRIAQWQELVRQEAEITPQRSTER